MKRQGILDHLENVGKNPKAVLHCLVYKYLRNLWYDSDGNLYKFLDYDKKVLEHDVELDLSCNL